MDDNVPCPCGCGIMVSGKVANAIAKALGRPIVPPPAHQAPPLSSPALKAFKRYVAEQQPKGLDKPTAQTLKTGFNCATCNEKNDYATANQSNGTYVCFNCR